jgi:hypothetical protein
MKTKLALILVGLFCLSSLARELPTPPDGFKRVMICDDKMSLLQPDGWYFKKVNDKPDAAGYFITKEKIEDKGIFETGLTLNVVTNVKKQSGKTPSEYAAYYLAKQARRGKKLDIFSKELGPFQNIGGRFLVKDELGELILHFYLIANDNTGTLFIYMFEAPKDKWDDAWEIGEVMFKNMHLNDEI